jgi:hypothetical protein
MDRVTYRYEFGADVPIAEVEATLVLSLFGVEALHGEVQTRLDAAHDLDREGRALVIDAGTAVGRDLNRLFVGFLRREFGDGAFAVERVVGGPAGRSREGSDAAAVTA